ncbi:SusC/RagA family TonB-linked outer membrane protein [Aestuariibaculum suncheonense]|uniref:TonB-dependent receptor n=1 Tax=Aestuariibaculum suncheonense TaxID=1028745 RepID=A0A8J6Q5W6_9FLAO|nr:TonB-dependent receptor [Aestuariibaculum suncheonense]MBD0834769.1 TonB-dependent receptor [Aestuariibaculum suncheonense]
MKQKIKKKCTVSGVALILAILFSSFSPGNVQAQERISGTVSGVNGVPLPGVNVLQKGTNKGAVSDFDGNFSIVLSPGNKTLVFSYLGFQTKEVAIGNQTNINVTLAEDVAGLDEVVIIGYAAVDRKKVLGATSVVKAESIEQATPVQAFDAVQGKLSGVQILSNNGPGEGYDIRIRGISTFGSGTEPLYVVDGQQLEDIDNLDPSDIATFEVLKDGATAAIYGSRAANGVVLITTKSGKSGKLQLEISSTFGVNTLVGDIRVANTDQRILYQKLRANNDPSSLSSQELDSLNLLYRNSYDLQKLLTRPAMRQQTNVALSGGSDKTKFYWNTGYLTEDGVVRNSGYKRINTQLRLDVDATKTLKVGTRATLTHSYQNGLNSGNVFQQLVERIPFFPLYEPDGSYTYTIAGRQNPLAQADLRKVDNKDYRAQVFNYAQLEIIPKLTVRSTLGINWRLNKRDDFAPRLLANNFNNGAANGRMRHDITYDIQQENTLSYKNKFGGKHSLLALAGMQMQKYVREFSDFRSDSFNNDIIETFNNAAPGTITSNSFDERHNLYSLFGQFNYDYADKYLMNATIRRDGSSRFGDENEFGYFPSLSLGWRVSNENFLKESNTINNLMLRASWGVIGNERINNYEFTGAFEPGFVYDGISGVAPTRIGNSELGWEETESTNLGLELSMFKSRLDIVLDLWKKKTTDLLANTPLPEESGFSGIRRNIGAVNNKGIDFSITGTILESKDLSWRSNFNIGILDNEVVKLAGGTPFNSGQTRIEEGQPIGNFYGYQNLGVFPYDESNAFTPDGAMLTPNFDGNGAFINYTLNGAEYTGDIEQLRAANNILQGGDIIWEDIDGNFVIDEADRQIIGNGLSTVYGGFSNDIRYKNLSVSFLFDFSMGQDIYRRFDEERNDLNSSNETPGPDYILNGWRNPGDITEYPRLNRVQQQRLRPNSFYVTDGDYIKWRYVRFNYDFPKNLMDKLKVVNRISLNLAVNNVLTWTNYIGYNPELGNRGNSLELNVDNLRYPNDRELILGLKVQF